MLTIRTATFAQNGSASHAGELPPKTPRMGSTMSPTLPNCGLNRPRHTMMLMKAGMA